MADVQPLRTLRYAPEAVGSLEAVIAPPYDVIGEEERAELLARAPFNVVEIDLPRSNGSDPEGPRTTLWRMGERELIAELEGALADAELLIADGHHRYETARLYADEIGGEGEHRYVLMLLVSLSDPGLTVLPTHRLLSNLKEPEVQERLGSALKRDFEVERIEADQLEPPQSHEVAFGYMDAHFRQPF